MSHSAPLLRFITQQDMPQVLEIEEASFNNPWTRQEFLVHRRDKKGILMGCFVDERLVAYVAYLKHDKDIQIMNFAVDQKWRRKGIASHLLKHMVDKLTQAVSKDRIYLNVSERNVVAQLLLRKNGFVHCKTIKGLYSSSPLDSEQLSYQMEYAKVPKKRLTVQLHNRISAYMGELG